MKLKAKLITWTNDKYIKQENIKVKLNDDAHKVVARIDKLEMKFFLPLHETNLWKRPLYYEISNAMPMTGEPVIKYPQKYLVVEVK